MSIPQDTRIDTADVVSSVAFRLWIHTVHGEEREMQAIENLARDLKLYNAVTSRMAKIVRREAS